MHLYTQMNTDACTMADLSYKTLLDQPLNLPQQSGARAMSSFSVTVFALVCVGAVVMVVGVSTAHDYILFYCNLHA